MGRELRNFTHDHNYKSLTIATNTLQKTTYVRSKHCLRYLPAWENSDEAQYKTFAFDYFGEKHEKCLCWLYYKYGSMYFRLCEKYGKPRNTNDTI